MRIGIEGTVAIKQLGGISEYARQLIQHLGKIDHENTYRIATASLFRSHTTALPSLPSNMQERPIPVPARLLEESWYRFGRPSLSYLTGDADVLFYPRPLLTHSSIPAVATVHDVSWLLLPHLATAGDLRRYEHALWRTVDLSQHIITVSEATKQDLMHMFKVPEHRVSVTYLGYDEALTSPPTKDEIDQFRRRYHIGEAAYFLHVGTLEPRKNIKRLVQAFSKVKHSTKIPHKLVLLGRPGWLYQDVIDAIAKSAGKDDIIIIGNVDFAVKRVAYWGALAVVIPSLYEGFGLPIVEAQACHRPVMAGSGGSLQEVGADAVLRCAVEDADALAEGLRRIVDDTHLRQDLVKRGQANITRFSWTNTARQTKTILERVARA